MTTPPVPPSPVHVFRERPGVNRRQALSLLAASVALANGACSAPPNARIYPFVHMPEAQAVGTPVHYASAFVRDGHAQGVLIGTVEGRPIKVEGNPLHPSSLGATDVFAQASVLQLWDPDRSATVRQALGSVEAGTAPQAASSWSAFDTAWRQRAATPDADQGRGLRLLTGPLTSPTQRALIERLLRRFPQARWHVHDPVRDAAAREGLQYAFGRELAPLLHLQRARCVLALAADPFSDGPGAV